MNELSIKALGKCQPGVAEKWAINTRNEGPIRKDSLFLVRLCQKGQKWPFQCQPRPFYKRVQTRPCCLLSLKDIAGSDITKLKVSRHHMQSLGRKGLKSYEYCTQMAPTWVLLHSVWISSKFCTSLEL